MRLLMSQVLLVALGLGATGCGGGSPDSPIRIRGKLLKNGQPAQVDLTGRKLPPGESGRVQVTFYPVKTSDERIANEEGETLVPGAEMAAVESDGTFHLQIKSGKYRIVVTHIDPASGQDLLKGVFNEFRSKVTRDVTADQEIIIDLAKPNG